MQPSETAQKLRIGASNVADICGQGYLSPKKLWKIKTGRAERKVTPFMTMGAQNEFRAITAVECDMDMIFSHTGPTFDEQMTLKKEFPFYDLVMLPDGISGPTMLEVKCPQTLRDEVPMKYQIQICVGFMLEPSFTRCLYAEWSPAETRKWWVYPKPSAAAVLWEPIKNFAELVLNDIEPKAFSSKANPKPDFPGLRTERT
jgi:hypothetical protein